MIRGAVAACAMSGKPKNLNQMVNSTVIGMLFLACYVAVVAQPYLWGEKGSTLMDGLMRGHNNDDSDDSFFIRGGLSFWWTRDYKYLENDWQKTTVNYKAFEVVAMICASIGIFNGKILSFITLKFLQDEAKKSWELQSC